MSADLSLASALVDELEELGARFSFFLEKDNIEFAWCCKGVSQFQRCRSILSIGLQSTDFGETFRDEIGDRYLAGRMRIGGSSQ